MGMTGLWARLTPDEAAARVHQGGFHDWTDGLPADRVLDLDKMWHAVHVTLAGTAWDVDDEAPLTWPVFGGYPMGPAEAYGPARYFAPEVVVQIAAALGEVDVDDLRSRFDPGRLEAMEVYPQVWDEPADDLADEVTGAVAELTTFFRAAADAGDAVVTTVT